MKSLLFTLLLLFSLSESIYAQYNFPPDAFVMEMVPSSNNTITIPARLTAGSFNYTVKWYLKTDHLAINNQIIDNNTSNTVIPIGSQDTVIVEITGVFPAISFQGSGVPIQLYKVHQWGSQVWSQFDGAFKNCTNFVGFGPDIDAPNLTNVTNTNGLASTFESCYVFNGPVNNWDVSTIKSLNRTFYEATGFNQPLNTWDVSQVTDMFRTFSSAEQFNQPLNSWDVSNVTTMFHMFSYTFLFNQPLNDWSLTHITDLQNIFSNAAAYSPCNLDVTFQGWLANGVPNGLNLATLTPNYTSVGASAVATLRSNNGWTINTSEVNPAIEISTPTPSVCPGETIEIETYTNYSLNNFYWDHDHSETSTYLEAQISNDTTFVLHGSYMGCPSISSNTLQITTLPVPEITLTASSLSICPGQSVTLTAQVNAEFEWNTGATTEQITATLNETTTFTVSATGDNGCVGDQSITIVVTPCASVDKLENTLSIYPNPTDNHFTISTTNSQFIGSTITLMDLTGRTIASTKLDKSTLQFSLENEARGAYIISIKNPTGNQQLHKIIKR